MKTLRWIIGFYFVAAVALFCMACYATSKSLGKVPVLRYEGGVLVSADCGCSL